MKRKLALVLCILLVALTSTACGTYDLAEVNENVINANGEFAFNIFQKLNDEDPNESIFISPLSISTALTMTYNGAESTTKEAMAKALGFEKIERVVVNASYSNLLKYLNEVDQKIELNLANSIWIREGEKIKDDFLETNKNNFNAKITELDFSQNSAADTINNWISQATQAKIEKMLEPPIDPNVIMYLINAIYFKGEWSQQFDPDKTYDRIFNSLDGQEQTVKMMNRKGQVEYTKGGNYKAVRLPYGDGKISMYCILPEANLQINEFIAQLTPEKWQDIRNNLREVDDVMLQIPKFKLEYGIKELNDSLATLGMGEAFSEQADFTGIREGIYISRVMHKAVIEVNEEGSEAAAATVVEMRETAAREPITFIADRPFMFVIADDSTDTILFMGKLLNVD